MSEAQDIILFPISISVNQAVKSYHNFLFRKTVGSTADKRARSTATAKQASINQANCEAASERNHDLPTGQPSKSSCRNSNLVAIIFTYSIVAVPSVINANLVSTAVATITTPATVTFWLNHKISQWDGRAMLTHFQYILSKQLTGPNTSTDTSIVATFQVATTLTATTAAVAYACEMKRTTRIRQEY